MKASLLVAAAALALLVGAPAAARDAAIALAPNEVLLEVEPTGVAHNIGDNISLTVPLSATAATAAEARRQLMVQFNRLSATAHTAGVQPQDVTLQWPRRLGFIGNEGRAAADGPKPKQLSSASLVISVRDPARLESLRDALESAGADVGEPIYSLSDEGAARQAANAEALRKGRDEADAYARALGMRVARLLRVSDHPESNTYDVETMQNMMRMMMGNGTAKSGDVETDVRLSMEFALAPVP
jgi:uncharacterized protein YggE